MIQIYDNSELGFKEVETNELVRVELDKIGNSVVKAQELNSWEDTCLWA